VEVVSVPPAPVTFSATLQLPSPGYVCWGVGSDDDPPPSNDHAYELSWVEPVPLNETS